MAVTPIALTTLTHTTAVTVVASPGVAANATDGNTVPNGGNTTLVMNNTGGSTYFVDVYQASNEDGLAAVARRFSVPATTIQEVKLGPPSVYGTETLVKAENVAVKLSAKA